MNIFSRLAITVRLIGWALSPPRQERDGKSGEATPASAAAPAEEIVAQQSDLRFYVADFNRAVDRRGRLALLFPGCLAPAAPFLLFRLKRSGFSDCRAVITAEGLHLSATR